MGTSWVGDNTAVAEGTLLNGKIGYDIGPPTPNLASNEAYLFVTDDFDTAQTFVLTYEGQSALMLPDAEYPRQGATLVLRAEGPMEFKVYDSMICAE